MTTLTKQHIKLTAAEVANYWSCYMNDSLVICVLEAFSVHVEHTGIRDLIESTKQMSIAHMRKYESIFKQEQYPIPDGFSVITDLYKDAPALFTDEFYLYYIQNIGKTGLDVYAYSLTCSARLDVCEFFSLCVNESVELFNKATALMLSMGIFIRSPYISPAHHVEYVKKESYMAGLLGHHRPLNAIEISNIYINLIHNQLGRTLLMGFSQTAQSEEVRNYMVRGRDIADKHVEIFRSLLVDEFLPQASAWSTIPTDSTSPVFSDKLMMVHTTVLNTGGIGYYGRSLAMSPRRDLSLIYVRLMAEVGQYAEDGVSILIKNSWYEQPTGALNRDELATK